MTVEAVVWGVPGCGKTRWAVSLAQELIYGGLDPSRVAYLAFTKAAAKAAATRILDSEDESQLTERFPFFRTIHSLGYMGLRKNKPDLRLLKTGDMKHFARTESMEGAYSVFDWEDLAEVYRKMEDQGRTEWDQALSMYNLSRVTARGVDDLMKARTQPSQFSCKLGYMELGVYQAFVQKYEKFKEKEGLIDFTDMLEYAMTEMPPIECEYAILDECVPAGTMITMADGSRKPIETVQLGEKVLGLDHRTGKLSEAAVVETRSKETQELVILDDSLYLTSNHPVYVVGRGYVRAGDLKPGDQVVEIHDVHIIRGVKKIRLDVRVYNIGTSTENYFAEGFLVHNCQDLSAAHHAIVDRVLSNARQIFWVGDDDQAIYGWSGASAELFLERAKRARYQVSLLQTHRFGQSIVDFSKKIIRRVSNRHDKETVALEGKGGRVILSGQFKPVFGDYLILHRHVAGCQAIARDYIEAGIPFRCERGGSNPLGSKNRVSAWRTLDILAKGGRVQLNHAADMIEELMPGSVVSERKEKIPLLARGARTYLKQPVLPRDEVGVQDLVDLKILTYQGADTITQRHYNTLKHGDDLEYFDRTTRNGYDLDAAKVPRIVTIHGAKGRQAKGVVVFTEMGKKCWDDPDAENRLAYVAATRTESDVTICAENKVDWAASEYDYPMEGR